VLTIVLPVFVGLGIRTQADRFTWFLENAPVLLGLSILLATDHRF
jgi:uncharacterized membrane protein YjdF